MNRREFLQCAAILTSGATVAQSAFSLTSEQKSYLANAPDYVAQKASYFTAAQRELVSAMAEVIIPATETPGAIDAGVPKFIELMVAQWLNDEERAIFDAGLAAMEKEVPVQEGKPFAQLPDTRQLQLMEAMEKEAGDSSWYERGNVFRSFISDAPFICQVKELTVWGFFTSEVGCTEVLRYDPMPMQFDGDIPLSREESTWVPRIK